MCFPCAVEARRIVRGMNGCGQPDQPSDKRHANPKICAPSMRHDSISWCRRNVFNRDCDVQTRASYAAPPLGAITLHCTARPRERWQILRYVSLFMWKPQFSVDENSAIRRIPIGWPRMPDSVTADCPKPASQL